MSSDLNHRYGADNRRSRTILIVAAAVLGTLLVAWVGWAGLHKGTPAVRGNLLAYEVLGEHEVRARFAVTFADDAVEATCQLRATAEDHIVVGELNVSGAALREAHGEWLSFRTERRATTVELVRCRESDR